MDVMDDAIRQIRMGYFCRPCLSIVSIKIKFVACENMSSADLIRQI